MSARGGTAVFKKLGTHLAVPSRALSSFLFLSQWILLTAEGQQH